MFSLIIKNIELLKNICLFLFSFIKQKLTISKTHFKIS